MSTPFELREPGAPVANGVPLCVPFLGGNEARYLQECIETNFVSSVGPFVTRFEHELAERVGAKHAIATSSGTAALHIALLVAGVEPEDEVLVSTLTFIAPANAVRYVGAWPVFVDAERDHWQMDPQRVIDFVERTCGWDGTALRNRTTNRRVRAIVPVHILGHPVDMAPLREIAFRYRLSIVEDATESLGASCRGEAVGTLGDIACFSFNGNKLITTGAGGMIVTDDESWARRAKYLTTQAKDDPLEYEHHAIGFNYRLSSIHAALGCAQLEKLDSHLEAKRKIASFYETALRAVPGLRLMRQAPWATSAWWLYTVLVDEHSFGMSSRELLRVLDRDSVQARPLWQPMHQSIAHAGAQKVGGEVADALHAEALSLPSSVGITEAQLDRVVAGIEKAARTVQ